MSKEKLNRKKISEYQKEYQSEIVNYFRMKATLDKVLESVSPYYEDVRQLIGNLWLKEQHIINISGTIYNLL